MKTLLIVFAFVLGTSAAKAMPLHQAPANLIVLYREPVRLRCSLRSLRRCYPG